LVKGDSAPSTEIHAEIQGTHSLAPHAGVEVFIKTHVNNCLGEREIMTSSGVVSEIDIISQNKEQKTSSSTSGIQDRLKNGVIPAIRHRLTV
jgi:hypothetical protein